MCSGAHISRGNTYHCDTGGYTNHTAAILEGDTHITVTAGQQLGSGIWKRSKMIVLLGNKAMAENRQNGERIDSGWHFDSLQYRYGVWTVNFDTLKINR